MVDLKTNGFCELSEQEMFETEGGFILEALILGGAITVLGAGINALYVAVVNGNAKSAAAAKANEQNSSVTYTQISFFHKESQQVATHNCSPTDFCKHGHW